MQDFLQVVHGQADPPPLCPQDVLGHGDVGEGLVLLLLLTELLVQDPEQSCGIASISFCWKKMCQIMLILLYQVLGLIQ